MSEKSSSLDHLPPCNAAWFARGGQSQTLLGYLLPSPRPATIGSIWHVDLGDGDRLLARVHEPQGLVRGVLLLFHGLGGNIESNYMGRSVLIANRSGLVAVRVNLRGAGEGLDQARGIYHSGSAADLSEVIAASRARWPDLDVEAVGFSLSGNVLLNLLGGLAGTDLPDRALVFNPAIDLPATSRRLKSGFNRLYDASFVMDLKALLKLKKSKGMIDSAPELPRFMTLETFDELFTAKAAGFRDRADYYERCSSRRYASSIRTPCTIITAADDPFVPVEAFRETSWPESVKLRIEAVGGHLGYLSMGAGGRYQRWMDQALEAWINEGVSGRSASATVRF